MLTSNHYVKQANQLFEEANAGIEKQAIRYQRASKSFKSVLEYKSTLNQLVNEDNSDVAFASSSFVSAIPDSIRETLPQHSLYSHILPNNSDDINISGKRENFVFSSPVNDHTFNNDPFDLADSTTTPTGTPPNDPPPSDRQEEIFVFEP